MSHNENIFIRRTAYEASEGNRLQGEEMEVDERYVAMLALADNAAGKEAVKSAMEFYDVVEMESGLYMASLAVVNRLGKPFAECVGEFEDGYWTDVNEHLRLVSAKTQERFEVDEGYVRAFDPTLDGDLVAERESLLIPA